MKMKEKKILYTGTSLESCLFIKNKLDSNGIKYLESTKKNDNWFRFILQLFFIGTGSYGMNGEHIMHYNIYVETEDYSAASQLIKGVE
ncbi:hypothetical protein K413DRAFT_2584 [Clostridium sp. ASBs410]|nr:hypothetical protein K413DRAFT_2584 [Clostridium sp. ASBs410]